MQCVYPFLRGYEPYIRPVTLGAFMPRLGAYAAFTQRVKVERSGRKIFARWAAGSADESLPLPGGDGRSDENEAKILFREQYLDTLSVHNGCWCEGRSSALHWHQPTLPDTLIDRT